MLSLKTRFMKQTLPFVVTVLVGTIGLAEFCKLRYTFRKQKPLTKEEQKALGMKADRKNTTLEEEYENYKKSDIDLWQNIRGPRPWEDSKSMQDEQRKNMDGQST